MQTGTSVYLFNFLQSEEARIAREVEAHEKRIRKELEKQDLLRRKVPSNCPYIISSITCKFYSDGVALLVYTIHSERGAD